MRTGLQATRGEETKTGVQEKEEKKADPDQMTAKAKALTGTSKEAEIQSSRAEETVKTAEIQAGEKAQIAVGRVLKKEAAKSQDQETDKQL